MLPLQLAARVYVLVLPGLRCFPQLNGSGTPQNLFFPISWVMYSQFLRPQTRF